MWSKKSKALPALYWLPKILCLRSSLTVKKGYTLNNHEKTQTILLEYQILVLWPDNDIAKNISKRRNVLASQTIE